MRIVAIPVADAQPFSAQAFIRAGSIYETTESSGATHLLEHLLFADGKADRIAESAGFLLNATTYREFMRLYAEGPAGAWKEGIRAISQLLNSPQFEAAEKEWQVIRQEDSLAVLDPHENALRAVWQSAASGSPWALKPMGDVSTPAPKGVREVFGKHFVGSNMVVLISGKFEAQQALAELRKAFASVRKGATSASPSTPSWSAEKRAAVGSAYAAAAPIPGLDKAKDYMAFEVAAAALTSPTRLQPFGLEARNLVAPSAKGSLGVLTFTATDGAPGLGTRASQALTQPISDQEFIDAVARVRARYSATRPSNLATLEGLSFLLAGARIDFGSVVGQLTKADADKAAGAFAR